MDLKSLNLVLPFVICMILGRLLNLSGPPFSQLENKDKNNIIYFTDLCLVLNKVI